MQSSITIPTRACLIAKLAVIVAVSVASACADAATEPQQLTLTRRSEIGCVSPAVPDVPQDTVPPQANGSCLPGFEQISWW